MHLRSYHQRVVTRPTPHLGLALAFLVLFGRQLIQAAERPANELVARCHELAEEHGLHGVVLVAHGDEVVVERAYGSADPERGEANVLDTRFLVASLTKPFVAFAALRLVDQEVLGLDDTAASHLPDLAETAAGRATVHQLLSHTSGLPHYEGLPELRLGERPCSTAELLAHLSRAEAIAEPGARHHYSGPGYLLLGLVLEQATGESLPELMERLVFAPLELEATRIVDGSGPAGSHAVPLVRGETGLVPAGSRHASTLRATGGVITTARDLHRFLLAVHGGELLSEAAHEIMLTPVRARYACGLIVYRNPWLGGQWARHLGTMEGVAAHFVVGLDEPWVCLALSNVGGTRVDDIDDALLAAAVSAR